MQMMQRRLREEELRVLRGQTKVDERALDEALMENRGAAKAMKRPGGAGESGRGGSGGGGFGDGDFGNAQGTMYGSMAPMEDDDESDDDDLGDDGMMGDEGESDEGGSDDDSDGQVEFTHEGGGLDDDDDDDDDDEFGDGGEEDDDF